MRALVRQFPGGRGIAAAVRRALRAVPRRPRPLILMYHRVAEDPLDPWGLSVSPSNFAGQMHWLAAHRNVIRLAEFAERHRRGTLPSNSVAVTFDDGYASALIDAAPILEGAGVPATVYLPAELIERGDPFWWDDLQTIVFGSDGEAIELDGEEFHLGPCTPADGQWRAFVPPRTARQFAFERLWAVLHRKSPADLDLAMMHLRAQAKTAKWRPLEPPMSPEQIRTMAGDLIEFGSHTLTHPSLPALTSAQKAIEIDQSRERCKALTGSDPLTFAYPFGDRDPESERLVKDAGYSCACATDERPVSRGSTLFALPRIAVTDCDAREFGRRLAAV